MCWIAQIDRGDSGWIRSPDGKLSLLGGHGPDRLLYLHTDYEGAPRVATDASGHVVWRWNGNAFGTSRPTGGRIQTADDADRDDAVSRPIATINLRYPGQYYDQETGFFYNGARYYDPGTGRYVTSDPMGLLGGINTYAYGLDNPLLYVDPSGYFPWGTWWDFTKWDFGTGAAEGACMFSGLCEAFPLLAAIPPAIEIIGNAYEASNLLKKGEDEIQQAGPVCIP